MCENVASWGLFGGTCGVFYLMCQALSYVVTHGGNCLHRDIIMKTPTDTNIAGLYECYLVIIAAPNCETKNAVHACVLMHFKEAKASSGLDILYHTHGR